MSEAGILTVIGMAVVGLVWALRIEGKVEAHSKELAQMREDHTKEVALIRADHNKDIAQLRQDTQSAVKEMRDDVRYIKERIDALVDRL